MEDLVHNAVQELWRPTPSELSLVTSKGGAGFTLLKPPPSAQTLSGSSDPCYVEAYHLTDPNERRLTLHLKVCKWVEGSLLSLMDKAGARHDWTQRVCSGPRLMQHCVELPQQTGFF